MTLLNTPPIESISEGSSSLEVDESQLFASEPLPEPMDDSTTANPIGSEAHENLVKKIADTYFEPKPFESRALYERLGIRTFKKYLPTTGDWMMSHVWHGKTVRGGKSSIESVVELEKSTRRLEAVHIGGSAVYAAILGEVGAYRSIEGIAISAAFQAGANIYPIMLQRYNRIRANRIINRRS